METGSGYDVMRLDVLQLIIVLTVSIPIKIQLDFKLLVPDNKTPCCELLVPSELPYLLSNVATFLNFFVGQWVLPK